MNSQLRHYRAGSPLSIVAGFALLSAVGVSVAEEQRDFNRDVVPALTKLGCNSGACHGSLQGRGRFCLSLLGFDPQTDYDTIVKGARGRRVSPASPEQSLLLRKATAAVPHGGGKRLDTNSSAYVLLREYIAQGMRPPKLDAPQIVALEVVPSDLILAPEQEASLTVQARWSEGSTRDVTAWALYDSRDPQASEVTSAGIVTAHRPGKSAVMVRYLGQVASVAVSTPFGPPRDLANFAPVNYIDELTLAQWKRLGVSPAAASSDATFVRRLYLDLIGTLPTVDETRAFVSSGDPAKRDKLIDALLERPEYVDYWSLKWSDLLRVHRRYVGDKGLGSFGSWLRRSVRENKPLDLLVRELLTAQGSLFSNGPVAYYFVDQKPEELAETTAQLFLGVRLQCARCHHHPMEVWTQNDYYGLAAFFTRLEVRDSGDKGRFGGLQSLRPIAQETRKLQVASPQRLLGVAEPIVPVGDVREVLAVWLTKPDNPFFARNFANRYWAYLTGRGLVEPVDDMRATNPPTNPALLDALANDLASHHFDVKHLVRTICKSRVYQLDTEIAPQRDRDGALFTHRVPRRLGAEVLLDGIHQATGSSAAFPGTPLGTRAIALPDPTIPSSFLTTFGRPLRNSPCECARESSPDLLQALHLVNNTELHARISHPQGRVAGLIARRASDAEIAEELYLAAYCRPPHERESSTIRELVPEAPSRQEAWEDVLWMLLNSPEFAFNH